MGSGCSAKARYSASDDSKTVGGTAQPLSATSQKTDQEAPQDTKGDKTADDKSVEQTVTLKKSASKNSLRRPSFQLDSVEGHEEHVMKRENEEGAPVRRLSASKVQTEMEIWWMESIPTMYGVSDSDDLAEEHQEDKQAAYVQKIMEAPQEEVPSILMEWLKDCVDQKARQEFIDRVMKELAQIDDTKKAKHVTINVTPGAEKAGKLKRQGTGFVTSGQVRALACHDMLDEDSGDESDEDEKDDDEFERELENRATKTAGGAKTRLAVSSEAHKVDKNWKPPVYQKTPDQHQRIADAVSESFMFAALGHEQLEEVIKAFEEVKVEAGTKVIVQGAEVGENDRGLYVLEAGELEVFKNGSESPVFTYTEMGQYFGDLALLYNAPRSATVVSTKPCTLWSIDRTTFNCLVKDAAQKVKERRFTFLSSVTILQDLDTDEVAKINDAMRERTYGTGVHIIKEGDDGEEFFLLEKGSAAAIKEGKRVKEYTSSDYFGELSLLKNEPRAADVVTLSDCTVLSLQRKAFHRLLGPLDAILKERAKNYDATRIV